MSKQLQHQTAENVGNWDAIIEMGKKGKAKAMQLDEDAAELNGELGGDGMQERVPSVDEMSLSAAKPVDCPICPKRVTPGSKDSITSPCGHTFHASCYTNWIVRKPTCPVCRKTLAPAPVESDGASDDDAASDDIVCNVCGDGTDGDNNPILMCSGPHPTQTGQCAVAMHMKCLDRPPASCIGVNCWCSQHWKLASRGDIKLAATAGTSSACTTAIDRAARGPPLRAGASASTLAPAAAKGKKPGSSIAKKKMWRAVPKKGLPTSEQLVSKPIPKQVPVWRAREPARSDASLRVTGVYSRGNVDADTNKCACARACACAGLVDDQAEVAPGVGEASRDLQASSAKAAQEDYHRPRCGFRESARR
jgi:hypothetical protein